MIPTIAIDELDARARAQVLRIVLVGRNRSHARSMFLALASETGTDVVVRYGNFTERVQWPNGSTLYLASVNAPGALRGCSFDAAVLPVGVTLDERFAPAFATARPLAPLDGDPATLTTVLDVLNDAVWMLGGLLEDLADLRHGETVDARLSTLHDAAEQVAASWAAAQVATTQLRDLVPMVAP